MFTFSDEFNPTQFLRQYWQKKPLLIRAGLVNFIDPLTPDMLASIAMEDEADSRVVSKRQSEWKVAQGPFDSYEQFNDSKWSLLVQGVEQWHPDVTTLLRQFNFIPNWRVDDIMVSFSVPGGGVGPHLDQYDVFIIQGQGKRHWRVGLPQASTEVIHDRNLCQIDGFDACIDAVLNPGDILYIPPGHPHEGYAIEPSLNYSVGFRAPSQRDLISGLADAMIDNDWGTARYDDPKLTERQHPGELLQEEVSKLQSIMNEVIDNKDLFINWFGKYNTESKIPIELDSQAITADQLQSMDLTTQLQLADGLRALHILQDEKISLFINAEHFILALEQQALAQLITSNKAFSLALVKKSPLLIENMELLSSLITMGLLIIDE